MVSLKQTVAGAALALAAALCGPGAAGAETPGEMLFVESAFESVPAGSAVYYAHRRDGERVDAETQAIEDGEISITLRNGESGAREALVAMTEGKRRRELHPFPAAAGNPLLMVFLELSLRSMATITGGSPFYIRNRMKDALRSGGAVEAVSATLDGAEIEAEEIVFRPFEHDQNRERMGAFADLELRFVMSEQAPGRFLLLSAETPGASDGAPVAYREEIALRAAEAPPRKAEAK